MLGNNIHGNFSEVEIFADSHRGSNAGMSQYIFDDGAGELVGRHFVGIEITSDVKKSFIDGVDMDVFGGDVASINGKNSRANFNILLHTWRRNNERATWNFF